MSDIETTPPPAIPIEENEKRRDLRIPLRILRVEAKLSRKQEIFFGYASNISTSGLFIQTPSPKERGTQVKMTFTLPTAAKEKISCLAEVAWVKPFSGKGSSPGMGLKFIELPADARIAIDKFIEAAVV